jgi:hypothetical protein
MHVQYARCITMGLGWSDYDRGTSHGFRFTANLLATMDTMPRIYDEASRVTPSNSRIPALVGLIPMNWSSLSL